MSEPRKLVEILEKDGKVCIRAVNEFYFDPILVATMCYVTYKTLVDLLPDNKQLVFERHFMNHLFHLMEKGDNYMDG